MIVSFLGGLSIISTHVGIRVLHNLKVLIVVTSLICLDTGRIMHVQSLTPEGLFSCLRLAHSSLIGPNRGPSGNRTDVQYCLQMNF